MHSYAVDGSWAALLNDLGVSTPDVMRRAGLPETLLTRPTVRLRPEQYYRLWTSLEAAVDDPAFPVRLCHAARSESFSPPIFAALCSPNLLVAAQRLSRYKTLVGPLRLEVRESVHEVTFELAWLDGVPEPPASLVAAELLFAVALARMGTREEVRPLAVTTTRTWEPVTAYADFLGVTPQRDVGHTVTFRRSDATRPFLTSNEELWTTFEPHLRGRLADLTSASATTELVRGVLLEGLPSGRFTMDSVAATLLVSKRTLQRRLEAEQTSYQAVLQRTRLELAEHYLNETTLPVAEISFLLGFSESTSFYRAFRAWTGSTPESRRRERVPG